MHVNRWLWITAVALIAVFGAAAAVRARFHRDLAFAVAHATPPELVHAAGAPERAQVNALAELKSGGR